MPREAKSFSRIAFEQFKRNKLAIIGTIIVFFLVMVAVFAPLIASDKPIAIKTILTNRYETAFYVFLDTLETLQSEGGKINKQKLAENNKLLKTKYYEMMSLLPDEEKHLLKSIFKKLDSALKDKNFDLIKQLKDEFESKLSPDRILSKPKTFFPLVKNLNGIEFCFIVIYIVFWAGIFLSKDRIAQWLKILGISIIIVIVSGVVWHVANPPFFDPANYKEIATQKNTKWAIFPIVPFGENENITAETKQKPYWLLKKEKIYSSSNHHWLGTDSNGRDVLARMIYGSRIAVSIGIVAVSIYVILGIIIGAIAGYFGGWIDIGISRFIEIVICFPVFFLILTILAYLKPSIYNIMVVIGLVWWTGIARLERGEFLRLVNEDFVQAVKSLGGSNFRIIFRHILPNALGPILVSASFGMAGAILLESALSFLGFGVPQPMASWGDILKDGQNDIQGMWWLTIFPGFAIFITVTAFNLIGDGIRDATDPKLRE